MPPIRSQDGTGSADIAVLTGDIVRSSRLSSDRLDAAMAALARGAEAMSAWDGAASARFIRVRGDGWQCLAPAPRLALRATLFLRASLRAESREAETRISIGIGPGALPSPAHADASLSAAHGPAFELSGRGLDRMPRAANFSIAWSDPPPGAGMIAAVVALSDEISRRWTPRQAELLLDTLSPGDEPQERLAERRGISQQAVAKHLRAGGDGALRVALAAVEATR